MAVFLRCRWLMIALLGASALGDWAYGEPAQPIPGFRKWLEQLWPEAEREGISRQTFEMTTRDLEPDLSLPDLIIPGRAEKPKGQAEFIKPPAEYLSEPSLSRLAATGRKLMSVQTKTLGAIEKVYGVPGPVVLAIWGRETDYGSYLLPHNAIRVLATQAYLGKRKETFRREFLLALKMVQEGHVRPADMRSSWAGAMGQTQFLPSDFYNFGVDFDGDGRIDIWTSVPDTLASAAKQLVDYGWQRGKPWGSEVRIPKEIDCTMADAVNTASIGEWIRRGVTPAFGRQFPEDILADEATLLLPAGAYGPAFLVLKNFQAIRSYNASDLYAIFVGNLSDRIAGRGSFETRWGRLVQLQVRDVEELQHHIAQEGFYHAAIDGMAGSKTRSALGRYQKAHSLKVDCWPTAAVLTFMRSKASPIRVERGDRR
jgi:lytic murein transglycosylase